MLIMLPIFVSKRVMYLEKAVTKAVGMLERVLFTEELAMLLSRRHVF